MGFLTEWQFYAQKLEGDAWAGDKLDKAKVDKMSGGFSFLCLIPWILVWSSPMLILICGCLPEDQQLGQLYELMQTIKNNNEGDGGKQ